MFRSFISDLLKTWPDFESKESNVFVLSFQIYEGFASSAELGEKTRLTGVALQSFRRSVELDLSQTDLLLKIGELMLSLPIEEHGKARSVRFLDLILDLIVSSKS